MAEITAALVKQLRERTGAGMMECKKALTQADGDMDAAEVILRKAGIASASKKSTRSTKQGLIGALLSDGGRTGVLVEVNCESDFVARNEDFQELVQHVAEHIAEADPKAVRKDEALQQALADENILYEQPFSKDRTLSVGQHISTKIAKIGENIAVSRFARYSSDGNRLIATYIHPGAQLGVLVELTGLTAGSEEANAVAKDVAMQIAAVNPQFISRQDVRPEALEQERDIARARALSEGKPEKVVDRIVEGRMAKYYEEVCLLDQPFIKENTLTVEQLLKKSGKDVTVSRFSRFKVGETQTGE